MNSPNSIMVILFGKNDGSSKQIFQEIEQNLVTFNISLEGRLFCPEFQISFMEPTPT